VRCWKAETGGAKFDCRVSDMAKAKKKTKSKTKVKQAPKRKAAAAKNSVGVNEKALREKLADVLSWGEAHADWKKALSDVDPAKRGVRPQGVPHSLWELLEHTRLAQWDILEFTRDADHKSPEWPSGYWPKSQAPADEAAWDKSVKALFSDMKEMQNVVNDPKVSLDGKLAHGSRQTLLRQILLLADHSAYHLGEFVLVRRALGDWKEN
jgi:hypothetical protein